MVWLRVLSRTTLADPSPHSRPKSHRLILLRTLGRRQESQLLWNQENPRSLRKIPGVGVPLRDRRCTEAQKCPSVSPLPATLTHSVSRKSFPCHSYANTRDRGVKPPPKSFSPLATHHSPPASTLRERRVRHIGTLVLHRLPMRAPDA